MFFIKRFVYLNTQSNRVEHLFKHRKQNMNNLKVKNHLKFSRFNYDSEQTKDISLGDIVIKNNQIGVVIQTFADGDFRTDMYGISDNLDSKPATLEQVAKFRPNLLNELE